MKYLKSLFGRLSLHRAGLESLDLGLYKSCNVCPGATFNRSAADTLTLLSFDVIDRNSSDLKLDEFVFKIFYHFSFFFYFEKKRFIFSFLKWAKPVGQWIARDRRITCRFVYNFAFTTGHVIGWYLLQWKMIQWSGFLPWKVSYWIDVNHFGLVLQDFVAIDNCCWLLRWSTSCAEATLKPIQIRMTQFNSWVGKAV